MSRWVPYLQDLRANPADQAIVCTDGQELAKRPEALGQGKSLITAGYYDQKGTGVTQHLL